MSVSSPCEICGTADVTHACDRCGQLVCDEHFDEVLGLCIECAAEVTEGREGDREPMPDAEDLPDGVDYYRS